MGVKSVKTCLVSPVYTDSNSHLYYLYPLFVYIILSIIMIWSFDCDEGTMTGQLVSEQIIPVT